MLFVHEKQVAVAFPLLSCFGYFLNQLKRPATAGKLRRFLLVDEKVAHSVKRLAELRCRYLFQVSEAAALPYALVRNWSSLFLNRMLNVVSDP